MVSESSGARAGVVASGIGVVSPLGDRCADFAEALRDRGRRTMEVNVFPPGSTRVTRVSQIAELPPVPSFLGRYERRLSRCDRLAVAAALAAWHDAGLPAPVEPDPRVAVCLGVGAGGLHHSELCFAEAVADDALPKAVRGFGSQMLDSATRWVAFLLAAAGPHRTYATACSSSLHAIARGAELIASGAAEMAVCGGAEALSRITLSGFNALRAVDPDFCRPFHRERAGLALGEGAAFFVLERARDVLARGGRPRFSVLGAGVACDAHHMTQPDPEGLGAVRAMTTALERSGTAPERVAVVEAHGTATPHNDVAESRAIARVFDGARPVVTAVKGNVGHTLGAAGAFGVLSAATSLQAGVAPAIAGTSRSELDPECAPLEYSVDDSRPTRGDRALVNSFAFGGNDVSLVIGAPS